MAPKRKRSSLATVAAESHTSVPLPPTFTTLESEPTIKRRGPSRKNSKFATNPEANSQILDGLNAARASPDDVVNGELAPALSTPADESDSSLSDVPAIKPPKKKRAAAAAEKKEDQLDETQIKAKAKDDGPGLGDPEVEGDEEVDEEEIKEALSRPPPVNSDYLPLPWKGRIGYACLNTYLRYSTPPVFSSRTCRIASILEHRHPLKDSNQPEHATKNRPDKEKPPNITRGQEWVESIGLANARDIIKMLRWNDRYGIKFMRLSSEMFPFASHNEYGYKLAPFAAETLAEVGKVVAELGHRVTTHPGQFTQLGSPRKTVVDNAIRDLEYHDEMLSLLELPPQQNRDAVMILHMGGTFGSKEETLDRFRENYGKLSPSIKNRLVLENDDMCWSVHDLLPICQELNIPLVLDFHHHNIIFDKDKIREGTKDIMELFPVIRATWTRKNITQKMHYSESTPAAITPMQRRKHSPRVATLPPCAPDMDLMIEAKDKEQAVFELMRTFKLPGFDTFNDIIPHVRNDDNKFVGRSKKKATPKKKKANKVNDEEQNEVLEDVTERIEDEGPKVVPEEEVGMGGPEKRVYWPPGMEDWLRPKKREIKRSAEGLGAKKTSKKGKTKDAEAVEKEAIRQLKEEEADLMASVGKGKGGKKIVEKKGRGKKNSVPTPSPSNDGSPEIPDLEAEDEDDESKPVGRSKAAPTRKSKRAGKVNYVEVAPSEDE